MPRFGFVPAVGNSGSNIHLDEIGDFDTFYNNYIANCEQGIEDPTGIGDIVTAYNIVGERYSELFLGEENVFKNLRDHLLATPNINEISGLLHQLNDKDSRPGIQYLYDFLKDLVLAYQEFINSEFAEKTWNKPDKCLFPFHNLLGRLENSNGTFEVMEDYRTDLIRPPIVGLVDADLIKAKHLFERMSMLAKSEIIEVGEDNIAQFVHVDITEIVKRRDSSNIKITPSKGKSYPLSKRAIPYYYTPESVKSGNASVRKYWSYKALVRKRQNLIPAYYPVTNTDGDPLTKEHLLADMDAYNFFRIEGHLFKRLTPALTKIKSERRRLNLPFDIRCIKLPLTEDEVDNLTSHDFDWEMGNLEIDFQKYKNDLLCYLPIIRRRYSLIDQQADEIEGEGEGGDNNQDPDDFPWKELVKFLKGKENLSDLINDYETFTSKFEDVLTKVKERLTAAGVDELAAESSRWENIFTCLKEPFDKLKEAYEERAEIIKEQLYFKHFAEAHPGMEHQAGVPKGGTFILVYSDLITNRSNFIKDFETEIEFLLDSDDPGKIERGNEIKEGFEANSDNDAWLVDHAAELKLSDYIDSRIIADFALPYLCCSSVPGVTYEIREPAPIILLNPERFCKDDTQEYLVAGLPAGGEFEDRKWLVKKDGKHWFIPNEIPEEYFNEEGVARPTFEYIFDGQVARKSAKVYLKPEAKFTYERLELTDGGEESCNIIGYSYIFSDTSENAQSVEMEIEVNGESVQLEEDLTFEVAVR